MDNLNEHDLSGISNADARTYLLNLKKVANKSNRVSGKSLQAMFQNDEVLDGLKEILLNLLTINPYFRWTASECLAHPVFDDIRVKKSEGTTKKKLKLAVDQDDAFDYGRGVSNKFKTEDVVSSLVTEADSIH